MKVLFIYRGSESLAVELLSAVLKKNGIRTELEFFPGLFSDGFIQISKLSDFFKNSRKIIKDIIKKKPDLIAFSVVTDNYRWSIDLAEKIKKHVNIPIIFGGIHPTILPEKVLENSFVDYVCVGEGEDVFPEFCNKLETGEKYPVINNIWYKKEGVIIKNRMEGLKMDIEELPFSDKGIFYNKAPYMSRIYTVMTGRGCPYNCSYCNNNVLRKLYKSKSILRRRSPENVIKELIEAKKKYRYKYVLFEDDAFIIQPDWTYRFLKLYKKNIRVPFECQANPRDITEKLTELLKKSGCAFVSLGIQSMNENLRKNVLNRYESIENIYNATKILRKKSLPFNVHHILGIPGETEQDIKKAYIEYFKMRPKRIQTFGLTYYPGTQISEMARVNKYLGEKELDDINDGNSSSYYHGGNISKDRARFNSRIRNLGCWGVFFPNFAIKILQSNFLFSMIPENGFIGRIIPELINVLFRPEIRGKYVLFKYMYHLLRSSK